MIQTTVRISGMACSMCEAHMEHAMPEILTGASIIAKGEIGCQ